MALRAGRVGVNPADVNPIDGHIAKLNFTGDPIIIGQFNGKDIKRVMVSAQTGATENIFVLVSDKVKSPDTVVNVQGMVTLTDGSQVSISYYNYDNKQITYYIDTDGFKVRVGNVGYTNAPIILTIDYMEYGEVSTLNEE